MTKYVIYIQLFKKLQILHITFLISGNLDWEPPICGLTHMHHLGAMLSQFNFLLFLMYSFYTDYLCPSLLVGLHSLFPITPASSPVPQLLVLSGLLASRLDYYNTL